MFELAWQISACYHTSMQWEQDDERPGIHILVGEDEDGCPVELGQVEPSSNRGFWHFNSSFTMHGGGADSLEGCKQFLIDELKQAARLLVVNLDL